MDAGDIGVVQRRQRLGLVLQPSHALGIVGKFGWKNLDGDRSLEHRVAGAIHLAHAAATGQLSDFIGAETRADLDWQIASMLHRARAVHDRFLGRTGHDRRRASSIVAV